MDTKMGVGLDGYPFTVHIWIGESLAVGGDGVWPVGEAQGGTHRGTEDGRGPPDGTHRAGETFIYIPVVLRMAHPFIQA